LSPPRRSLALRLLVAQVVPLALLAVALAAAGAAVAERVVERTSDRLLAGSVLAIAEQVGAEDGHATVRLSPWSLGLLDGPERDAVFYSVWEGGRLVTGYRELPPQGASSPGEVAFRDGRVLGMSVRTAQTLVRVPGLRDAVVIAVAQTRDSRRANVRELLSRLIALPVLLVAGAALLIWPATVWSLGPLRALAAELTARSAEPRASFAPASLQGVPREVAPLVRAYNGLLANLARTAAAAERFAADASHQLRTPLSVVTANLALLARPGLSRGAVSDLIADSRDAAARMGLVLRQLLALARAEAAASLGPAELGGAVRQAIHDALRAHRGAAVHGRLPHEPVMVRGDGVLLAEMLRNLMSNAVLHGGGEVFVWAGRNRRGDVAVTIWDHGPGIAPGELERLPERFYRGASAGDTAGAGLGIAIARTIAQACGGGLAFENRARRSGLVVRLTLRLA
jgi:two-component system sensor histidine kinase TctE